MKLRYPNGPQGINIYKLVLNGNASTRWPFYFALYSGGSIWDDHQVTLDRFREDPSPTGDNGVFHLKCPDVVWEPIADQTGENGLLVMPSVGDVVLTQGQHYLPDWISVSSSGYVTAMTRRFAEIFPDGTVHYQYLYHTTNYKPGALSGWFYDITWEPVSPHYTESKWGYHRGTKTTYDSKGLITKVEQISSYKFVTGPTADTITYSQIPEWDPEIQALLASQITAQMPRITPTDEEKYFACRDALRELDTNINLYEFFQPFVGGLKATVKSLTGPIKALATQVANGHISAKTAADMFLADKYGWQNLVRDLQKIPEEYDRLLSMAAQSTLHLHGKYSDTRATIRCRPLQSGIVWTDALGITPNLSNLWDLVPFSFVVDWAFKAGENLEEIEFASKYGSGKFRILWICYSQKHTPTCTLTLPGFPDLKLTYSVYKRWVELAAPAYVYTSPDYFSGLPNHIIEFGALIITNAW